MARRIPVLLTLGLGLLVVGCQQKVVSPLPAPNLNGPVVIAPKAPPASSAAPQPEKRGGTARRPSDVPAEWVPRVAANSWQWIVIHHSATPSGSATAFDRMHRQKGWDELGYHFVIGNGTGSKDGQVEVGSRWPVQKWGAHTKTVDNRYNDHGIGICLVGNFDLDRPTNAQISSLIRLTSYLMRTYRVPPTRVIGHGQAKPTDCPGRNMNVAEVRRRLTALAEVPAADGQLARRESAAEGESK